jgi:2-dehydro-3-deoxygalactonokinase
MNSGGTDTANLICIDTGTTNTRVWYLRGDEIIATARAAVGVRDTAREGSPRLLFEALRQSIARVCEEAISIGVGEEPWTVIAAGMITSPLGLREVPHLVAPAGLGELATHHHLCYIPEITNLPIRLVPGVRSGPAQVDPESVGSTDVMRGEETLGLGLVVTGQLKPGSTILNLGSHWKIIRLDDEGRISSSVTSLTGELIHASQTQTILASSVPAERPAHLNARWLKAGMAEARRSGLPRALFCVRLLEQRTDSTADDRLAYLIGACLAADLDGLLEVGHLPLNAEVVITGGEVLAGAMIQALAAAGIAARSLSEAEIEAGLLAGLRAIASLARPV